MTGVIILMYKIVTRTKRTVQTDFDTLEKAVNKLKLLELNTKRARIYSPGYYQIEKYEKENTTT